MTEKFQIYMKNVSTKCVYFVGGGLNCGLFQGQESNGTTVWHHRRVWENVGNNREWVCSEGEDFSNSNKSAFRSSSGSTPLTVSVSQRVLPCYTRLKLCLVFRRSEMLYQLQYHHQPADAGIWNISCQLLPLKHTHTLVILWVILSWALLWWSVENNLTVIVTSRVKKPHVEFEPIRDVLRNGHRADGTDHLIQLGF